MTCRSRSDFAPLAFHTLVLSLWGSALALAASDDPNPFGVGSSAQASGLYAAWMPKMAAAGVEYVRVFPEWNQVQPTAGTWSWSLMDSMLNTAASNQLKVSGLLLYNASWINSNTHTFPTNHYPEWSAYVSNVVRHAAGRVQYWEVWNEPESFAAGGTPADYARVVTNAYNAAKAADPSAQVGLSVASVDVLYLERTIQAGAADHFDYICVHPYEVLGSLASGQEALYMSIVPTIRKMLAVKNPAKWRVPIWFTEIGEELGGQVTSVVQGQDLVKAYTMGIAQGVSVIQWFEAQEGGYKMGLLNSSGNPTPSYTALANLAAQLGGRPTYVGWVLLNDKDYAFVFQGPTNTIMAAWAPPGSTDTVDFGQVTQTLNPVTGSTAHAASFSLSNAPVLVIGVPSGLVAQAQTNRNQPFPWGGNYSGASAVSVAMGSTNLDRGLHQLNPNGSSTAVTLDDGPARDCSKGPAQTFTIDPNFLSYTHASIRISAVVRKISASDNPGFNLKYESATGRKGIGWNSVPGADKWYTLSWTISDDEFVGNWAHHFSFDSDSTNYSRYYLQQVTVTNLVPRPTSAPTSLIANPGVGLVSLQWNSVPGVTGYNLKRAKVSHGPYEMIIPTVASTNHTDSGLAAGMAFYYVVSAVNLGGEGPDSAEAGATPLPPTLGILLADGVVQCTWPTSATGFALQETSLLRSGWTNSLTPVHIQGVDNVALLPTSEQVKFFRLAQ
jgi:polysaccharide biosynthesis protein PslG